MSAKPKTCGLAGCRRPRAEGDLFCEMHGDEWSRDVDDVLHEEIRREIHAVLARLVLLEKHVFNKTTRLEEYE